MGLFRKLLTILVMTAFAPPSFAAVPFTFATQSGDVTAVELDTNFASIFSGNNSFPGSVYFKSGSPWIDVKAYGALGDGITDDTTAVQNAINAIQTLQGGIVYFPLGNYCLKSGVTVGTSYVRLVGESNAVELQTCGANATTIYMNAGRDSIENLTVSGPGFVSGSSPTGSAILLDTGCVGCWLYNDYVVGGRFALDLNGNDILVLNVLANSSYGSAVVFVQNAGMWFERDKFNQAYPAGVPAFNTTINNWAASTAYTTGVIVSTQGYNIQCTHGGTSGSSAPTLQNYGVNILEGTGGLTWQLIGATTYFGVQLDTGALNNSFLQSDFEGTYTAAFSLTNSASGTPPRHTKISDSIFGNAYEEDILAGNGSDLTVQGSTFYPPFVSGGIELFLNNAWAGDASIIGNTFVGGGSYDILDSAGINMIVDGNKIFGASTACIQVSAGVAEFVVSSNNMGASTNYGTCANAMIVATGASEYYNIVNNIIRGATNGITDGGTGTNKTITGNH